MVIQSHGRWLEVTVDPILDDNQRIVAVVHIIVDITERKAIETESITDRKRAEEA